MNLFIWATYIFQASIVLSLTFLFYILLKFLIVPLWKIRPYKKQGLPTNFFFLIGLLRQMIIGEYSHNDIMHYYKTLSKQNPSPQAEVANLGNHVGLMLFDSKIIKSFYNNQSVYRKINPSDAVATLMGSGLVLAEGDLWKNHRKTISSIFHFEFLKDNIPLVTRTTEEFLEKLGKESLKQVDIMDEIQKITGEIVGRIFFGENLNQYTIKGQPLTLHLAELTGRCSQVFRNLPVLLLLLGGLNLEWSPIYRELMNDIREFRDFCSKIVGERKASGIKTDDLLGLLLENQKTTDSDSYFSDVDIVNEFVTFEVAGMDTTGHMITMALYLLAQHPQYIEMLEKEIREVYGKSDHITIKAINQMDIMHAVFKETLRFYLPVPGVFPRLALEDHDLMGIKVKKGMFVGVNPLYNYFNSQYFEEPEKFKPERWLSKKESELDPYIFTPFSAGARNCIGQHFAIIKAKIIVAEFLKRFNFKMVPQDYKLTMTLRFLYEPKEKIYMDLEPK